MLGKFGHFNFLAPRKVSFVLNTGSNGVNGTQAQCLTYFYYLPNITGTQLSITINKVEPGDSSVMINKVNNSPFNGWMKREVNFISSTPGYQIIFQFRELIQIC